MREPNSRPRSSRKTFHRPGTGPQNFAVARLRSCSASRLLFAREIYNHKEPIPQLFLQTILQHKFHFAEFFPHFCQSAVRFIPVKADPSRFGLHMSVHKRARAKLWVPVESRSAK